MRAGCASAKKPRIAWFSVLNTQGEGASLSGWYSDQLLPLLCDRFEIELFHSSSAAYKDFPTFHYLTAVERHRENPYDAFFYQMEDCKAADFTRMHVALMPGIALFHDFLFTSDGPEPILNSPWKDVLARFHSGCGEWPERLKEHKKEGKSALRESGMSVVPVFSSERDLDEYRRAAKNRLCADDEQLSFYLPVPVPAIQGVGPVSVRRAGAGALILLYCGSPRVEHRAHKLLGAVSGLGGQVRLKWLVAPYEAEQARQLVNEFELDCVDLIPERSPSLWAALLKEGSLAIHTHFSVFGHTRPYLQMSLASGVPSVVSDFGCSDYLSDKVVFKVPPGEQEAILLREIIGEVLTNPAFRRNEIAKNYAQETFSSAAVADELAFIFERSGPVLRRAMRKWSIFEGQARKALLGEVLGENGGDFNAADSKSAGRLVTKSVFSELGWSDVR